jgi:4-hydroxy-tetrahydrodipicolinate reductase
MMEMMAARFPGAFAGYGLAVTESHQAAKKDTSGTAKAVVASFRQLGLEFDESQVCDCVCV